MSTSLPEQFPAQLQPSGDSAILVTFGTHIDLATNRRAHALARWWMAHALPGLGESLSGLGEAVPGYATVLAHYDPQQLDYAAALELLRRGLAESAALPDLPPRRVEIPVQYGGEFGPDLGFVVAHCGLSEAEVVAIHTAGEYPVYFIGFTPGFPYLGGLDERLAAPRLPTPRPRVPAGSVGIAGEQTGIYPLESPGGWRIIGRTRLCLFDPARTPPALLEPGDIVQFLSIKE
jgi:KipI family sensor histidine kinase inhibitor